MDQRLEQIFECWFDYEHSIDEDAKAANKQRRATLIIASMRAADASGTVSDFLHAYRDDFRNWMVRKLLKTPRKRF